MTYPPVPAAPVFPAGFAPAPVDMDNLVLVPLTFLSQKVMFRAQQEASQTLTGGAYTQVQYNTILEDPYSGWNSSTYVWLCPVGCSGWYEVTVNATAASIASSTQQVQAVLYLDGVINTTITATWAVNGRTSASSGSTMVYLSGGVDYIAGYTYAGASTTTPTTAGQYSMIEAVWVSN